MPPSDELLDQIEAVLRRYVAGLSRAEIAQKVGHKSLRAIAPAVTILLSQGRIKVLPTFFGSAQKFVARRDHG